MATQIETLRQRVKDAEERLGQDAPFVKLLNQQLAGMELNLHNKNERFLIAAGSPENYEEPQSDVETKKDGERAGVIRIAR